MAGPVLLKGVGRRFKNIKLCVFTCKVFNFAQTACLLRGTATTFESTGDSMPIADECRQHAVLLLKISTEGHTVAFANACRQAAGLLKKIADETPGLTIKAAIIAEMWLSLASINDQIALRTKIKLRNPG
jgi:hypothetical protein